MINLARWLRHLPRRKPARLPPEQVGERLQPVPADLKIRRFYEDKMLRPRGDYEDKEIA